MLLRVISQNEAFMYLQTRRPSTVRVKMSNNCAEAYGYVRVIYTPIGTITRSAPLAGSLSREVKDSRLR